MVVLDGDADSTDDGDDDFSDMDEEDGFLSDDDFEDTDVRAQDFHTIVHTILQASGFLDLQRTNMIWDLVKDGKR